MNVHIGFLVILLGLCSVIDVKAETSISDSDCRDIGVWIHGHIDCIYLKQRSGFGIHRNPGRFCRRHWDKCCQTCTELEQQGIIHVVRVAESTNTENATPKRVDASLQEYYYTYFRRFLNKYMPQHPILRNNGN